MQFAILPASMLLHDAILPISNYGMMQFNLRKNYYTMQFYLH